MNPGGRYNQIDLKYRAGDFQLAFEGEWDPPVAALFGPSGSGKTTILEIIAGLRPGASGRVVLDGRTVFDDARQVGPAPQDRWMGWVPQDASLFPHLTVDGNIRYGLRRGGKAGEARMKSAIAMLELETLLPRAVHGLSGGERQRIAVARAIASGARVLLLDEPLASLDLPLRSRVLPLFFRLRDELKLPMIYVSHDADEVLALAPHVLVVENGRCAASGRSRDLLEGGGSAGAYSVHSGENRFEAVVRSVDASEGTATVALSPGPVLVMSAMPPPRRGSLAIAIRAEEVLLALEAPGPISAQNVLAGTLRSVREAEGHAWAGVEVEGAVVTSRITRRALGTLTGLGLSIGARVYLVFKASSVRAVGRTDGE
jgi:molybdate transport system ATP-binding protein